MNAKQWIVDAGSIADMQTQSAILMQGIGTPREWVAVGIADEDGFAEVVALCHPDNAPLVAAAPELLAALEGTYRMLADAARQLGLPQDVKPMRDAKAILNRIVK